VRRVKYLFHTIGIVDVEETIGAHPGNERGLELSRQAIHVLQKGWQKFELSSAFWEILFALTLRIHHLQAHAYQGPANGST